MVTIHLDDSVAAALALQAQEKGLSLQEYLATLAVNPRPLSSGPQVGGGELERLLMEEATGDVVLPGTFTRAEIYGEHA
jgi:hypothetical protein